MLFVRNGKNSEAAPKPHHHLHLLTVLDLLIFAVATRDGKKWQESIKQSERESSISNG